MDPDDKDKAGQYTLAVTGFFLDSTDDSENEFIKEWNLNRPSTEKFDLDLEYFDDLIDDEIVKEYYYYQGSLTTPDCNEIVNWFVMKKPLSISKA